MKQIRSVPIVFCIVFSLLSACKKEKQNSTGTLPPAPVDSAPGQIKKWIVTTIAGDGNPFFLDGPALSAKFRLPLDVAVASDGTIYVADGLNHRIRKISAGMVSTFAGAGRQDTTDATGTLAGFSIPIRLAIDAHDNVYVLDALDARLREISTTGTVSTFIGTVRTGFADGSIANAVLGRSLGLAIDDDGTIYIGDAGNKRIRRVANLFVSTAAGTGAQGYQDGPADAALFFFPQGVAVDAHGNLFVADQNRIRKITPAGTVSTIAGSDAIGFADGTGAQAVFTEIEDLVIDAGGTIYATDDNRIRKISPQGMVTTIAGSVIGYQDGEGADAKFNGANGLAIDRQGNIYVADADNSRIRKISLQ